MNGKTLPPKFVFRTVLWGPLIGFGYVSLYFLPLMGKFYVIAPVFGVPMAYLLGSPPALAYAGLIVLLARSGRCTTFAAVCCSVLLSVCVFLLWFALSDGDWTSMPRWDEVVTPFYVAGPTLLSSLTCWFLFAVLSGEREE